MQPCRPRWWTLAVSGCSPRRWTRMGMYMDRDGWIIDAEIFQISAFLAGDQTWIQGPNLKPGVLSGFLSFLRPKTSVCKSAVAGPKSANSPSLNDLLNIFFTSPVVDYFQLCRFVAPLLHRAKPLPQAMGNSKASSRIKDVWVCGWSFHLQAHVHGMTDQMKLEGSLLCLSTSLCCILAKVAAVLRIYFKAL